jgi:ketosteroid isomerase-like protein
MAESIENLVRTALEAYQQGGTETMLELADPEVEIHIAPSLVNPGTTTGPDQARSMTRDWEEAWGDVRYEIEEFRELGDGRAVARVHTFAEGSFSGVKVDMRQGWLWEVRDGRFTRWHLYPNVEAALEAARALEEGRVQG